LSINKNPKLKKENKKSGSTAQSYIQSSSHVMATCRNLPLRNGSLRQFASAVILPPPSKKACP